jgi:magnesium and cobalt transporter
MKDMLKSQAESTIQGASAATGKAPEARKGPGETSEKDKSSRNGLHTEPDTELDAEDREDYGIFDKIRGLIVKPTRAPEQALHSAIEQYIEGSADGTEAEPVTKQEKALITNAIKLREMTVVDVMIPRASIVAIRSDISQEDLLLMLAEKQYSRLPVYRETLDDVFGAIHIKDILATLARGNRISIEDLVRDVPIVSPAMPVVDLIIMMKEMRKHMAFVVDEFGGIDGLVTIGDVIEAIIGEVEDEHAPDDADPEIKIYDDGTIIVDARVDIEEFEKKCGKFLTDEEREDIDTLGGLIFALAGRIPGRGEIITHPNSGRVLEVLDADPRRVNRVMVRKAG